MAKELLKHEAYHGHHLGSETNSASGINTSDAVLPIITIDATRSGSCLYFSAKM
jgi:hypothetical protein